MDPPQDTAEPSRKVVCISGKAHLIHGKDTRQREKERKRVRNNTENIKAGGGGGGERRRGRVEVPQWQSRYPHCSSAVGFPWASRYFLKVQLPLDEPTLEQGKNERKEWQRQNCLCTTVTPPLIPKNSSGAGREKRNQQWRSEDKPGIEGRKSVVLTFVLVSCYPNLF